MEHSIFFVLTSLSSTAILLVLWCMTAQKLRQARYHLFQQTKRLQNMRDNICALDNEIAMKDARIAGLLHDLNAPTGRPASLYTQRSYSAAS